METELKQRLVGLTVIFSLAVIFLPMLLDGSGLSHKHLEITIPPSPQINSDFKVEEKVIELKRETAGLKRLQPVIVDEVSDPADETLDLDAAKSASVNEKPADKAPVVAPKETAASAQKKDIVSAQKQAAATPGLKQTTKVSPEVKPGVESKPPVGGVLWVIQTGSFRDKNLAYRERDRIRKSKLSAVFIEKFEKNNKLSYRVRMGPFLTRNKADIVRNKVMAKYNIKGIVMKYEK